MDSKWKEPSKPRCKTASRLAPTFGLSEFESPTRTTLNRRQLPLSKEENVIGGSSSSEKEEKGVQTSERVVSESSSNNEPSPCKKRRRHLTEMDPPEAPSSQPVARTPTQPEQIFDDRLWPIQMQNAFLETLLVWKARNGRWCGGRFTPKTWSEIRDDLNSQTRRNYTTKQLQDKFNRMRIFWREMDWVVYNSGLTGVGWDSVNQTIRARPEQWNTMIEMRPSVKRIYKKGFPNFELMTDVFHDSGAQGTMSRSSNLDPYSDDQEREVLKKHEGSSKRACPTNTDTDADFTDFMDSPEADTNLSHHKRMKAADKDKLQTKSPTAPTSVAEEHAWQAFELQCIQKAKKYEAQTQLIEGRAATLSDVKYSFASCLRLLESEFPNISPSSYLKAFRLFQDPRYCMRWMEMKPEFRKLVVDSDFTE